MKFKHLLASMLAIAVAVVACEDPNADPQNPNPEQETPTTPEEEPVKEDGTEANPYLIKTLADLQTIRDKAPMKAETWFRLENDIDMAEVTNWVPVNYEEPFNRKIHFDGNNKTISNFKPATWNHGDVAANYPSFFGVLWGSCKNLTITGAKIDGVAATSGILAGYVGTTNKPATVTNVTVKGELSTTVAKAGGMSGACKNAIFENCNVEVSILTSSTDAGGFVGVAEGDNQFKGCKVKVVMESCLADNPRCGGFIGWNRSTNATIDDCHVLTGSSITDNSGRTELKRATFGGFIAYADNAYPDENNPDLSPSVLLVKNSSTDITIAPGDFGEMNSTFIATTGYQSTITLEKCIAKGSVTSKQNYSGGIVARKQRTATGVLTIKECSFEGSLSGRAGVGGIVGAIEGDAGTAAELVITDSYAKGTITNLQNNVGGVVGLAGAPIQISGCYFDGTMDVNGYAGGAVGGIQASANPISITRSYSKGSMTVANNYAGGFVGAAMSADQTIDNCYSSMSVTQVAGKKQIGALVGTATTKITIKNCFASGNVIAGTVAAGIIGRVSTEDSEVSKCIAWNSKVEALASSLSGAIIGSLEKSGTYSDCVRKSDMVVNVAGPAQTLTDQDNITTVSSAIAYNGKAAAASATLSSVAKSLGWSEEVWDLTKDVPSLK